ncbi:MAG: cytochrome c [Gammaproteobacteria bacterium]|nr:cytochrome c [Gammaproteobacteria bacterium]
MNTYLRHPLLAVLLAATTVPVAMAADGKALHDANCMSCHESMMSGDPNDIYTRDNRRVTSLDGLEAQVRRCEHSLGLKWFDDEVAAVTDFLNDRFYKFGQ